MAAHIAPLPSFRLDFEPCRDERCVREGIHPAHLEKPAELCPDCRGVTIRLKGKLARCACCTWKGPRKAVVKVNPQESHA